MLRVGPQQRTRCSKWRPYGSEPISCAGVPAAPDGSFSHQHRPGPPASGDTLQRCLTSPQGRLRLEPARREAFTRITKQQVEFPVILEAYEAVESWVRRNGHAVTGSPREVYFVDFDAAADHEPACDIAYPYD